MHQHFFFPLQRVSIQPAFLCRLTIAQPFYHASTFSPPWIKLNLTLQGAWKKYFRSKLGMTKRPKLLESSWRLTVFRQIQWFLLKSKSKVLLKPSPAKLKKVRMIHLNDKCTQGHPQRVNLKRPRYYPKKRKVFQITPSSLSGRNLIFIFSSVALVNLPQY